MKKRILALVIVSVLIVSAIGTVFVIQTFGDKHNVLDGCYAEVSNVKYVAAYENTSSESSSGYSLINSMKDYNMNSDEGCSLYKIDDNGNYVQIKFFSNNNGIKREISYHYDLVYLKKAGNLLYVIYTPDAKSHKWGPGSITDPEQYIISLESGKIYSVPDCNHVSVRNNEYGINITIPMFQYLGQYEDKPLFLKCKRGDNNNNESLCTMEIKGDKLIINEIFNGLDGLGLYAKLYKDDIVVLSKNSLGQSGVTSSFLLFPNSNVYSQGYTACDGYLCKTVEYTEKYFPLSCERFNRDGTSSTINFSAEESFRIASEDYYDNVIYRYDDGDDKVLVKVLNKYALMKITLKKSLEYTEETIYFDNYIYTNANNQRTDMYGNYDKTFFNNDLRVVIEDKRMYTFFYNNYKSNSGVEEPTVVDGKMIYRFYDGVIYTFNMETEQEGTIPMDEVTLLSSINVVNEKIYAKGISSQGKSSTVRLNDDGTITTSLSDMELRTYIMLPIYR